MTFQCLAINLAADCQKCRFKMLLRYLKCVSGIRNTRALDQWQCFGNSADSSTVRFRLIGSGACGDPSSFYVQTNSSRYIFNCGEGVARLAQANRIPLGNVENVFFTQTKWRQMGGLGSLLKIFWERHKSQIAMHGSPPLKAITTRILAAMSFPPVCDVCKFNETARTYEDSAIRINFTPLQSSDVDGRASTATAYYCQLKSVRRIQFHGFLSSSRFEQQSVDEEKIFSDNADESRAFTFLVLDVPSADFLDQLNVLDAQLAKASQRLDLIVHFSPQHIIETPAYEKFVEQSNASRHLKLNESNRFSNLRAPYEMQSKLSALDSHIFPTLRSELTADLPAQCVQRAKVFPKIVFLGTSSKCSRAFRNVTSILVHTSRNSCMLLDCGEGTCGQIARFYGTDWIGVIRKIKAVFISHMHADHYLGLLRLMELRKELMHENREPLKVLAPKNELKSWLFFYDNQADAIHDDLMLIDNQNMISGHGLSSFITKQINVSALRTCRVKHTETSYAVAITMTSTASGREPFKLTFSGDTSPCDDLIGLGGDSTLLIHEATFPDSIGSAGGMHCSMSEAIEQGRRMNAKYTMLTHFSHRHTIPWPECELDANVGIAFDNMELIETDLSKLNKIYSNLKFIFPTEFHEYKKCAQNIEPPAD